MSDAAEPQTIRICRDEDCPVCGHPETYAEGFEIESGPTKVGCRQCGWTAAVVLGEIQYGEGVELLGDDDEDDDEFDEDGEDPEEFVTAITLSELSEELRLTLRKALALFIEEHPEHAVIDVSFYPASTDEDIAIEINAFSGDVDR